MATKSGGGSLVGGVEQTLASLIPPRRRQPTAPPRFEFVCDVACGPAGD